MTEWSLCIDAGTKALSILTKYTRVVTTITVDGLEVCGMRPIVAVKRAIKNADPDDIPTIHNLLATFNDALQTELEKDDGGDAFRDVFWECIEDVAHVVKTPAVTDETDWEYLQELWDAYPPDDLDHHVHTAIVNAVGAGVLHTRFTDGIDAVPVDAADYLFDIGQMHPSDTAWEDAFAVGWYADHPDIDLEAELEAIIPVEEFFVTGTLDTVFHADPDTGVDIAKTYVTHPQSTVPGRPFESALQVTDPGVPRSPRYHSPPDHYDIRTDIDEAVALELWEFAEDQGLDEMLVHHGIDIRPE